MILLLFLQMAVAQVYFENLEEEIRYAEDPHYADYIREKIKNKEAEKKTQIEQRKATAAAKAKYEEDRQQQIRERDKAKAQKIDMDERGYKEYKIKQAEEKTSIEKARSTFITQRDKEKLTNQETRKRQLAKMQQEVSRLPANYFDTEERPRVQRKKRKFK